MKISLLSLVLVTSLACLAGAQLHPMGDLNKDYIVNLEDLQILADNWLDPSCSNCPANLDGIPGVNMSDFAILAENWRYRKITLVINEFMAKNDGIFRDEYGDADDWIELYNYGDEAIDIGGMYITDRLDDPNRWRRIPDTNPSVTTIAAHGYLLIWADNEEENEGILHVNFALSVTGEDIGLYDADRNPIDSISFGQQMGNRSYGRLPDASDNWQVFDNPTPRKPNQGKPIAVVINEIMYHPYHALNTPENRGQEYIELHNWGGEPVRLDGWRFTKGVEVVFPDVTLNAKNYLVVAADVNVFKAKCPSVTNVIGGWEGRLNNSGETIELVDNAGVVIDKIHYADEDDWAVRELGPLDHYHRGWVWSDAHDGGGRSLELLNPAMPNEYGQNWAASDSNDGTPGRANSVADNDIAPLILDVVHSPIIPGPNDQVTVTARIIDESTTGVTVTLHYRVDRSKYQGTKVYPHYNPNDYNDVTMFDDGAHGDGQAGDGLYGANIPAHSDTTIIEFFVEASDAASNTHTWPPPSIIDGVAEQVTNLLYQVDGSFDPDAPWVPGSQPIYYIIMTAAEIAELSDIGDTDYGGNLFASEAMSDAQMNATFISVDGVGTQMRYRVGVRNRGNRTRADPPMNYRVNFPHDRDWKGVTSLNINSKYPHSQLMGSALFQMAGLAAANATAVQVRVNGQNLAASDYDRTYGSYVALEAYDSDWVNNHFPDDNAGNVYRCTFYYDGFNPWSFADLDYKEFPGQTPNPDDYRDNYPKQTNMAEDDWSDLFNLIDKLNNPDISDANFVAEVSRVINLEKWVRYLATDALVGNQEGGLPTGTGDDYAMYRGVEDPRFWLLPHDMDALLGQGQPDYYPQSNIFEYAEVAGLNRLLNHPDIIRLYYNQYRDLNNTVFAPKNVYNLVGQLLGDWVPRSEIEGLNSIKQFVVERANSILHGGYPNDGNQPQIPQQFTIDSNLPVVSGFHRTDTDVVALNGTANAIETRSILVNGRLVADSDWSQRNGTWSIDSITLNPGINRVIVQAFDGPNGTGREIERGFMDIWYDTGGVSEISGTLTADKILDAASGPWHVTNDITVPAGVALTIEPGTTLFFEPGKRITINGRLLAEGTEYELIRFTSTPGTSGTWNGLQFVYTVRDNRITYAVVEYGRTNDGMVGLKNSNLLLDHVTLDNTILRRICTTNSSLIVRNSVFTDTCAPGQAPTDNRTEHIWGSGVPLAGEFIIENNVFGRTPGHNDAIDFDGPQRPNPIPQILNNVFTGGGDDALDLECDAHIEGNVFMNYIKDQYNKASGESNVISAGNGRHYVMVRNFFYNTQHIAQVKDNAFLTLVNNTVVDICEPAIYFDLDLPGRDPGRGAYVDGTVFWDTPEVFAGVVGTTDLTVNHSMLPFAWHYLGEGNIDADPLFVDPNNDFHLKSVSPAIDTGPCGLDMGAYVPAGACVSGEPAPVTYYTSATLTIGGPGITHYKYSVNNPADPWSQERSVATPIELTNLVNGRSYTVYVIGKNSAGIWQDNPNASQTWTVDTSYWRLVINEILAHNAAIEHEGTFPDMVELYYDGPASLPLAGIRITDNLDEPDKFVFTGGTLSPGEYMVLYADSNTATSGIHLGFALDGDGDDVYLYDKNGILLDSVRFGPQLHDLSIGRIGHDGRWHLTKPTFGQPNIAQPLGNPDTLKINEWLANGEVLFEDDFIELYNPHANPVDLSDMYLTDNPVTQPGKSQLGPLSFIAGNGFAVFAADDSNNPGHLNFKLSADGEMIGLFNAQLKEIDKVLYGPQTTDVSQGRVPDGSDNFEFLALPTPGVTNPVSTTTTFMLVAENTDKRVLVPTGDIGNTWRTNPDFNDLGWLLCTGDPGGVGYEREPDDPVNYAQLITLDVEAKMYRGNTTCYIRIPFTVDVDPRSFTKMVLRIRYDDGFVAYLNGVEVARRNFAGTPQWNSDADRGHAECDSIFFEDINITRRISALRQGNNVLAIHGMNVNPMSTDFLISVELVAFITAPDESLANAFALLDGLRVTELMYHAPGGSNYDYIELYNISDTTLDLNGVRITEGIDFACPPMTLASGHYVVVVSNIADFQSRYGSSASIAGQYSGNLSNGGEDIILKLPAPLEAVILRFRYSDTWYPTTDGSGDSLVIRNPFAHPATWGQPESWQAALPMPGRL